METKIAQLADFNNTLTKAIAEMMMQEKARKDAEGALTTGVQTCAREAASGRPPNQTPAPPAAKADGASSARVGPASTREAPLHVGRPLVQNAAHSRKTQEDKVLGPGQAAAAAKVLGMPTASTLGDAGANAEAPPLSQPSRSVLRPVPQGIPAGVQTVGTQRGTVSPSTETRTKRH